MSSTAESTHFNYLWCIAIDDKFKVLLEPFQLCVPFDDGCDILVVLIRMSFPALRKYHHSQSSLTLLKPRSPISSELLPGAQLSDAQVSHRHVVPLSATVRAQFKVFGRNKPGNISVIIHLTESDLGAYYLIPPTGNFDTFPQ